MQRPMGNANEIIDIHESQNKSINNDIEINKTNEWGETPLMLACLYGADRRIMEMLIDAECEMEAKDYKYGRTALHWAVDCRRFEAVELLLSRGSEVNARSNDGQTPLHRACWWGHLHTVDMLLGHNGIDANVVDSDGDTPLHVAVRGRNDKLVSVMLNQFCTVLNLKKNRRLSGIVVARYLSSQGADFHHKNNNNNTPLDFIKDPNLRKKLETFSPPQCVFCEDEVATETFFPCKHLLLCKKCCPPKVPKRCLKCGQKITSKNSLEAPTRGKFTTVSEPTSSKSQPVESPVLDEKFLQDVAQNLGGKWQQVGRELGIKTVRLEIIKNDNPLDTVEQSFQMLWRWFTHCDTETRTHRTLRKALEKCKCFDALECLPQTM
ncbi:E3 ubiquitin-protein ligase MIB1-like [Octopus vulgaris]|uniref:E3 ubiquitin-protein ligase MIB1-like n=1 Tax=Octopus vulgaris TaxID=6645 RepID=A0AA36EXJ9_OCTVU|nr:E3 ubiquitin-protein ligase MIB1-like [Octopus vulgaris]